MQGATRPTEEQIGTDFTACLGLPCLTSWLNVGDYRTYRTYITR